jgi:hypothetical protein
MSQHTITLLESAFLPETPHDPAHDFIDDSLETETFLPFPHPGRGSDPAGRIGVIAVTSRTADRMTASGEYTAYRREDLSGISLFWRIAPDDDLDDVAGDDLPGRMRPEERDGRPVM